MADRLFSFTNLTGRIYTKKISNSQNIEAYCVVGCHLIYCCKVQRGLNFWLRNNGRNICVHSRGCVHFTIEWICNNWVGSAGSNSPNYDICKGVDIGPLLITIGPYHMHEKTKLTFFLFSHNWHYPHVF